MPENHFDQQIDRQNSSSIKWSLREEMFGSKEVLPMWVADMDFSTSPSIISALEKRVMHGIFGYVAIPQSFFQAICGWLSRRFSWNDEVHADLICAGYRHTPVATLSSAILNNTITCMSPSKSFNLAGLQTAYLIIPNAELRKQYEKEQERLDLTLPNTFGVVALEAAYTEGENWLDELLRYLEVNLNFVSDFF